MQTCRDVRAHNQPRPVINIIIQEAYGWADRTFINCDLRYYNLASLGKFDAILIDPPWRIKGNQLISNEKTMFNNSARSFPLLSQ
jgi:hypothetical protein